MKSRKLWVVAIVIFIGVATAGCSGLSSLSGPSVSNVDVQMVDDGGPAIVFNYSVDDYSTVLLEDPDGNVINEGTLEPDNEISGLYMGEPEGGTYKIIIQQGGETALEKEVEFRGPEPTIQNLKTEWDGGSLEEVSITLTNSGDLPLYVSNANYTVNQRNEFQVSVYQWIPSDSTVTVDATPTYGNAIVVSYPGEISAQIDLITSGGIHTKSFSESFEGPQLKILDKKPQWDGNALNSVEITVANTGDLNGYVEALIRKDGEVLAESNGGTFGPGENRSFELTSLGNIYTITSGGQTEFTVVVKTDYDSTSAKISRRVEAGDTSFESLVTNWDSGQLESVSINATNNGDLQDEFTAKLIVNGELIKETDVGLSSGSTKTVKFGAFTSNPLYTVHSGGSYNVSVSISGRDETISDSITFEGPSGDISGVSASFLNNFDEDTHDLVTTNFDVTNAGDTVLVYDSVKISVAGSTRTESYFNMQNIDPGDSRTVYTSFSDEITVQDGQHSMEIRLLRGGKVVVTETVTISTSE